MKTLEMSSIDEASLRRRAAHDHIDGVTPSRLVDLIVLKPASAAEHKTSGVRS